jgi:hypothetical protein
MVLVIENVEELRKFPPRAFHITRYFFIFREKVIRGNRKLNRHLLSRYQEGSYFNNTAAAAAQFSEVSTKEPLL